MVDGVITGKVGISTGSGAVTQVTAGAMAGGQVFDVLRVGTDALASHGHDFCHPLPRKVHRPLLGRTLASGTKSGAYASYRPHTPSRRTTLRKYCVYYSLLTRQVRDYTQFAWTSPSMLARLEMCTPTAASTGKGNPSASYCFTSRTSILDEGRWHHSRKEHSGRFIGAPPLSLGASRPIHWRSGHLEYDPTAPSIE